MTLLFPLGLLGLIGIPILIIIYIIKNKYTEQVISSTYLWTLSERFLKRRNPIKRITGIISLILQILAVLFISVAVAHPVFTVPDSAYSYCFILDGSGSMNMEKNGKTRLETGKSEISSLIKDAVDGSEFTLIYVGNSTDVIYEKLTDKEQSLKLLNERTPAYKSTSFTYAIGTAQEYFNENPSVKTYLVTDKSYESSENVDIIDVSSHERNYAVTDVKYSFVDGGLKVTGNMFSYENDTALRVRLYLDDAETPVEEQNIWANKLEATGFEFNCDADDFHSLRVVIANEDALKLDNEVVIFNTKYENSFKTLLVSDNPFFLESILAVRPNAFVDSVLTKDYSGQSGYDLYIYDSFTPEEMPKTGAVWFINPVENQKDSGFTLQGEMSIDGLGGRLDYTTSKQTTAQRLMRNLNKDDVYLSKYIKCGASRNFITLMSYEGNPVVFAGTNSFGNREVVFAFDLHDSNFPILGDFVTLSSNLLDYTFPDIVEETSFYCGDMLNVNIVPECRSIKLETPLGNTAYLNTGGISAAYELTEVGVYTVKAEIGDVTRTFYLYSAMPEAERLVSVSEEAFGLQGEADNQKTDGTYGKIWFWFIIIAALFIADWAVYCYEQYQLR